MKEIIKLNTFLPYKDFKECAKVLDWRRLGKQRVEAKQILEILWEDQKKNRWYKHPAVQMWKGWEHALANYGLYMSQEWVDRGYNGDICLDFFNEWTSFCWNTNGMGLTRPYFITDELCISHQSNLIRKNSEYYRPIFGPNVPDDLPYLWPVKRTASNLV